MMPIDEVWLSDLIKEHSGELMILAMTCLLLLTLLIALPQLLRANTHKSEMSHLERLKSIEKGLPFAVDDDRSRLAGRTALLVPTIVMIAAATVTSFLVVYKCENFFGVTLSIWVVSGVVSLAAITGGVALIGRLAQIQSGDKEEDEEEEEEEDISEGSYMK